MAELAAEVVSTTNFKSLTQSGVARNLMLTGGAAAVIAVMAAVWMWSQQPEYRVLFANYSDRDGGAIVASLQQLNVPYKFAEGGGAILVPATQVHDARLKLASQGLPKGGSVGFELMENQKLGVSQFYEQINFQRALEGELARSIQAVSAVASARVHLALPKASVFVRDQQKPTASVLLNLNQGRTLERGQVSAIVHLVASSVPDLPARNVTIVDQNGNLLSDAGKGAGNGLDPSQLKYVHELQQNIVRRIESIITPIVGADNVRAEATADIDFSTSEQAAEIYKPNQTAGAIAIRSQQSSESQNPAGAGGGASGVPGALSNQPQPNGSAPINGAPGAPGTPAAPGTAPAGASGAVPAGAAAPAVATALQKDTTTNYEVDKTVRYEQKPMGGVKRLSVAVVVNHVRETDATGKVTWKPLTDAKKAEIADLVKEAMGYNKDRGDTLNVVNSKFAGMEREIIPEVPIWKKPETLNTGITVGKYLLGALVLAYLFFGFLKPMLLKLISNATAEPQLATIPNQTAQLAHEEPMGNTARNYQQNLEAAKQLARQDPKVVANVVKGWVEKNE